MQNIMEVKTVVQVSGQCGDIARAAIRLAFERNEVVEYDFNGRLCVVDPKDIIGYVLTKHETGKSGGV